MIIDCRLDSNQLIPASIGFTNKLMATKLISELITINENFNPKRNYMIIPMRIFNIIENHESFNHLNLIDEKFKSSNLYLIGMVCGIECYLDLEMVSNSIILTWNKQVSREIKLDSLLSNIDKDVDHLIISVLI